MARCHLLLLCSLAKLLVYRHITSTLLGLDLGRVELAVHCLMQVDRNSSMPVVQGP